MNGRKFTLEVNPALPPQLTRLAELAGNLRFSWHRPTRRLFEALDERLWNAIGGNPRLFLRCIDQAALDRAAASDYFLDQYHQVLRGFDAYQREARHNVPGTDLEPGDRVAYFCAEYGFHESFPNYSGGLGVLAGDHCKTASDVGLEFVGVGLLYRQGYFHQTLDGDGNQVPEYRDTSSADLPVALVPGADGAPVKVRVRLAAREVVAQVWRATVGRVAVLLLDTNVAENSEIDRAITHKLYGGDREMRLQQEMILGIGGVRALRALGLAPTVWHMNEGHAAFLAVELAAELVAQGLSFAAAREAVAAAVVFTTHTPVAAGHDAFAADLVARYFEDYARRLGTDAAGFLALGRQGGDFNMTTLALAFSRHQNGVSRIHGGVSARICAGAWPEVPPADNPIGYVTNGVHVPTFLFQRWKDVFDAEFGLEWRRRLTERDYWERIYELPDALFWDVKQATKSSLLKLLCARLRHSCRRNQVSDAHYSRLARWINPDNPRVLTIGFARRFATYKRATLLFRDPAWLASVIADADRPVVFVFAGKAHPADEPGRQMIRAVHEMAQRPEFLGRVLFVEDYDIGLARSLVAGVDVWLNNPVYPLEASGTSGMKAGINGTLNLSILDGWWAEGFDGRNGWAIPSSTAEDGRRDDEDARSLYEVLQDEVVPLYYERDPGSGLPTRWIARAKRSMATLIPTFNSRRMLDNYVAGLYRPAAAQGRRLGAEGARGARELADFRARIAAAWPKVALRAASAWPERVGFGEPVPMRVAVELNGLDPNDVRVELVLTREVPDGPHESPPLTSFGGDAGAVRDGRAAAVELFRPTGEREADGASVFANESTPPWCGLLSGAVRVVPYHALLSHRYELGLMRWL